MVSVLRGCDDRGPVGRRPGCAECSNAMRQKFSAVEFGDQECLPIFLFWTLVLGRANVNAKETIEQNTGTDKDFQIGP